MCLTEMSYELLNGDQAASTCNAASSPTWEKQWAKMELLVQGQGLLLEAPCPLSFLWPLALAQKLVDQLGLHIICFLEMVFV